jgi:hypothetical protein
MDHTYANIRCLCFKPTSKKIIELLLKNHTLASDMQKLGVINKSNERMVCNYRCCTFLSRCHLTGKKRSIYFRWEESKYDIPPGGQVIYDIRVIILPNQQREHPLLLTSESLALVATVPFSNALGKHLFDDEVAIVLEVPSDGLIRDNYSVALFFIPEMIVLP